MMGQAVKAVVAVVMFLESGVGKCEKPVRDQRGLCCGSFIKALLSLLRF